MTFTRTATIVTSQEVFEIPKGLEITEFADNRFGFITPSGDQIKFSATQKIKVGDFIIRAKPDDIYHCPRDVFLSKYEWSPQSSGKTLHNSDVSGARKNVKDIKVVGDGDMFALLCKASSESEGWMKSTKAMQVVGGCLVQVTTQQRNPDGSYAVAEALSYVPGVRVFEDGNGRKLVPI